MPVPFRFFIGLAAGVALSVVLFAALLLGQFGAPSAGSGWAADFIPRKLAAARAIPGPKLLIAGGSGVLFGVKARELQAALGIPTVNLGCHAAVGTGYMLDLARAVAARGDTVVLILEYEIYENGNTARLQWADPAYLDYMMAADPAQLRRLPLKEFATLALRVPAVRIAEGWRSRWRPQPPELATEYRTYDPANVDDLGDMTGHRAERLPARWRGPLAECQVLARGLSSRRAGCADIRDFCLWAKANDIRVLAGFPALCAQPAYDGPAATQTAEEIAAFYLELGVPMLGSFREEIQPRSAFFDTSYHLTEEAAVSRTARLATRIAPHLSPRP